MWPLSLIEGMVAGVDVLISNTDALKETIGDYPYVIVNEGCMVNNLEKLYTEIKRPLHIAA